MDGSPGINLNIQATVADWQWLIDLIQECSRQNDRIAQYLVWHSQRLRRRCAVEFINSAMMDYD